MTANMFIIYKPASIRLNSAPNSSNYYVIEHWSVYSSKSILLHKNFTPSLLNLWLPFGGLWTNLGDSKQRSIMSIAQCAKDIQSLNDQCIIYLICNISTVLDKKLGKTWIPNAQNVFEKLRLEVSETKLICSIKYINNNNKINSYKMAVRRDFFVLKKAIKI